MTATRRAGLRRTTWHTWTRWCSLCAQRFTHTYPDGCAQIECRCGAWIAVPALSVIEGGKAKDPDQMIGVSSEAGCPARLPETLVRIIAPGQPPVTVPCVEDETTAEPEWTDSPWQS